MPLRQREEIQKMLPGQEAELKGRMTELKKWEHSFKKWPIEKGGPATSLARRRAAGRTTYGQQ